MYSADQGNYMNRLEEETLGMYTRQQNEKDDEDLDDAEKRNLEDDGGLLGEIGLPGLG